MLSKCLNRRYSNYHYCTAAGCKNTTISTPGKLWIQIPTEMKMRNIWLKLAKRDPATISPKSKIYFCEDHFDVSTNSMNLFCLLSL